MTDQITTRLELPYIMPSQAQKHITHNEALRALDAQIHLALKGVNVDTPPAEPMEGDAYYVGDSPNGDWEDAAERIATFQDGSWTYHEPKSGWLAYDLSGQKLLIWNNDAWEDVRPPIGAFQNLSQLGVGTTADGTNKLSVSADATLLTHNGAGHQLKLNKSATSDTASLLWQNDWTGHAEIGLAGTNDFSIKVSANGSDWRHGIKIDSTSGETSFPSGLSLHCVQAYKTDTKQTLSTHIEPLTNWNGTHLDDGAALGWDAVSGECSINLTKLHLIAYAVSTEVSAGGSRTDSFAALQRFDGHTWAMVEGTKMRMYNRVLGRGGTTAAWTGLLRLQQNEKIRLAAAVEDGLDTVYVDEASLSVVAL
ncbi:MAG: DUF2793 domain-containing protein [Pseudomonadota bacterium]